MAETRAAGTIYDLGYQSYDGARLGRLNALRTLLGFSFRAAFGLGRGARAKTIPMMLLALVFIPGVGQVALAALTNRPASIDFAGQLGSIAFLLALFAAAQAPELVVVDRQHRVLPLYLSRPIRPADYAFAKLGAFFCALLVLTLAPQLLLFLLKVGLSETPWPAFVADWKTLGPIAAATALTSLYFASIGLAIASFTSRRAYGSAAVMAFFLLLPAAARMARGMLEAGTRKYASLASPFDVLEGMRNWVFNVEPGVTAFIMRPRRRPPPLPPDPLDGELFLYMLLGTAIIAMIALFLRYWRTEG
jgi:ABC-2 type transport system permease protein